jgi:hypothetical protein
MNPPSLFVLFLLFAIVSAQWNEPPGQRREQTFRVVEFELSNINQHYPGDLRYYCTFRGKWSKERHPRDFPKSASWSAPVLISHSKNYRMWTGTETVTAGVEYIAEQGYPTIMYNEFQNAGYETLQMVLGERMFNTTASQHLPPINVTYSHPWLSAMTKITPSPDWFVGFSDLRTISYDTETYYNRIVVQSYVWDSGTDEGQSYLSFDRDLDPQVPCMRMCIPPNVGGGGKGTYDSNIHHKPGKMQVHHPTGNTKKCPDRETGRVAIPLGGQFMDYSASYIPFPAEYECVLRVGDGEVYAGNEFNETQIRPPAHVARPDDDFLDGISPYDQPRYDNYVASLKEKEPEVEEPNNWRENVLWLLLLLLLVLCCTPFCCVLLWLLIWRPYRQRNDGNNTITQSELEEVSDDLYLDEANSEYDSQKEFLEKDYDGQHPLSYRSAGTMSQGGGSRKSFYDDDSGYGFEAEDDAEDDDGYQSFLASQRVSQNVSYHDGDGDDEEFDVEGDTYSGAYNDDYDDQPMSSTFSMSSYRAGDKSSYRDGDLI